MAYKKVYTKKELANKKVGELKNILKARKRDQHIASRDRKPQLIVLVLRTNDHAVTPAELKEEVLPKDDVKDDGTSEPELKPKEVKKETKVELEEVKPACSICNCAMDLIKDVWNKKVYQCTNENCKRLLKVM